MPEHNFIKIINDDYTYDEYKCIKCDLKSYYTDCFYRRKVFGNISIYDLIIMNIKLFLIKMHISSIVLLTTSLILNY